MPRRLGDLLVKKQLITPDQLNQALQYQQHHGGRLRTCLTTLGLITDDGLTDLLSAQYGIPLMNLESYSVDSAAIKLIPRDIAVNCEIVPISHVGSILTIAMTDPTDALTMDKLKAMTGLDIQPVVVSQASITEAITKFYGPSPKS